MKEYDFIIAGAGLAGLTAHHELLKKGYSVLTLESASIPGGRVRTENVGGGFSDTGAQFFTFNYPKILSLCRDLNVPVHAASSLMGQKEMDKDYLLETKNPLSAVTTGLLTWGSWFKLMTHILKLKLAHPGVHPENPMAFSDFDDCDARTYCLRHLNQEILDKIFIPYFSAFNYARPEELSGALVVRALLHMASGKRLMGIEGGLARLPQTLSGNKEILYEAKVEKMENGVLSTSKGNFFGKHFIVATTATVAKGLLGKAFPEELITEYSPSIHESFLVKKKARNGSYGTLVSQERSKEINVLTDESHKARGLAPDNMTLLGALYSREGALKGNAEGVEKLLEIDSSEIIERKKTVWKEAIPVLSPGRFRAIRKYRESLSADSGIILAGDYLSTGCAEGAVESGYFVSGLFASRL